MEIHMENKDIGRVFQAAEVLCILNEKYGKPHGENPFGIVLAAYSCVERRVKDCRRKKPKKKSKIR
jgi:hypothetical protein